MHKFQALRQQVEAYWQRAQGQKVLQTIVEEPTPTKFQRVVQPPGSDLCGQACIAMLAGISLDEACTAVGHRKRASNSDIIQTLGRLEIPCERAFRDIHRSNEVLAAVVLLKPASQTDNHWVVWYGARIWDPDEGDGGFKPVSYVSVLGLPWLVKPAKPFDPAKQQPKRRAE